jgi:hypothetical protein
MPTTEAPDVVRRLAEVLPPFGREIAERLLTDPRMRTVWPQLLKDHNSTVESVRDVPSLTGLEPRLRATNLELLERLSDWDIPDHGIPPAEQRCAAFFAFTVIELSLARTAAIQTQADNLAGPCLDAAALCRSALQDDPAMIVHPKLAEALTAVGAYFEEQGRLRRQEDSPYIMKRSSKNRGNDEVRAKTRALATATHRIFGSFLYHTVATVMVALQVNGITEKDMRNWCADLPCQ